MTDISPDYLTEWVQCALENYERIDDWQTHFDQARVGWQLDQAQKLLRVAKRSSLSRRGLAFVRYSEGTLNAQLGKWDRAVKSFMQGVDLLEESEYVEEGIWILNDLGMVLRLQGNYQGAEAAHQQALLLARGVEQPYLIAEALEQLGLDLEHRENVAAAIDYFREALAQRETFNDEVELVHILNHLGRALWLQGDLAIAQETLRRASTILKAAEGSDMYLTAQIQANLGNVHYQQGHLTEAENCWRMALETFTSLGVLYDKVGLLNNLGGLAFEKGDHNIAESYFQESLALARDLGDQRGIVEALTNQGTVLIRTHQWAAAADCYRQALHFDAGVIVQKRIRQSLARVHTLIAIDWLRKANFGKITWSFAIKRSLSEGILAITYASKALWNHLILLLRPIKA